MDVRDVLIELFDRIAEQIRDAVEVLDAEQLTTSPEPGSNTVGWLVWHIARGQDAQVADLLDEEQLWTTGDWAARFGLEPDPTNHGYGHSTDEMKRVRPDGPDVLIEYYDAVAARTRTFLEQLTPDDLDRVVDESWDPPVTLGVRLVSIANDDIQHAGQAAYVRGMLLRR